MAPTDFNKHTVSEWHNACTAGANVYPYGAAYGALKCIGADDISYVFGGNTIVVKASGPFPGTHIAATSPENIPPQTCQGAAPNLFDMSGNVAEWEDSCSGKSGASDTCRLRGGSYQKAGAKLACGADRTVARNAATEDIGFRCCSN